MTAASFKELATRENDGVEVSLYWNPAGNDVYVFVSDQKTGEHFEIEVGDESPLDVFNHPFAYAASRGIGYGAPDALPAAA
jgi:hypothetical protein